jgi:hypothetical protein
MTSVILSSCQGVDKKSALATFSGKYNKMESKTLKVNPLDLSFHFPLPTENQLLQLPVSNDLLPKEYFSKFFPQRFFEFHAWLFDQNVKQSFNNKDQFTTKNKALIDRLRKSPVEMEALKENVWNHLFVTGVRFEPCFPVMPTASQDKDFMKCSMHAIFLVAQVVVDGKAYGTVNTLNSQPKEKVEEALVDFALLRDVAGIQTAGEPIYIHPGFSGPNSQEFMAQVQKVFKKYFGLKTLFGAAFSAKSWETTPTTVKEIWNFNANAAPLKYKAGQVTLPDYARTTDQMLQIETTKLQPGISVASIDLDPPTVGPMGPSLWETDIGPGLEKKPVHKRVLDLANLSKGEIPTNAQMNESHFVDDPSKTPINKENCALCHLSATARLRSSPFTLSPSFSYDEPGANPPRSFGSPEQSMHPEVLRFFQNQNSGWLPYHHGYAFGTHQPIVSTRHINEMFAVSQMVNLKNIRIP